MISIYKLALSQIRGIRYTMAQKLLSHYSTCENIFSSDRKELEEVIGNRPKIIDQIINKTMFSRCERELLFLERYNIATYFCQDSDYPQRLTQGINDRPICLFIQGAGDINNKRNVAIVGKRDATEYGIKVTEAIVDYLKSYEVNIISGLAYGIDTAAHRASVKNHVSTFGVLGHGLSMIYPQENYTMATQDMVQNGGLISEYFSDTQPNTYFFPARNRLIAALSDVCIVVEANSKGGALITAKLASQYNREVMAVPGKITDETSEGCNMLIEKQQARILTHPSSISELMHWDEKNLPQQDKDLRELILPNHKPSEPIDKGAELEGLEKDIYYCIKEKADITISDLAYELNVKVFELQDPLFNMELGNYIQRLPGDKIKIK